MTPPEPGPGGTLPRILIVDDQPSNLIALQGILERPDYQLVAVGSGDEALTEALHGDIAVALLDVAMPGMDGFETARMLKQIERTRRIPILFVTASVYELDHIFRGYEVGAVDYLVKPVDPHAVRAKVAVFVEMWRQARRIAEQAEEIARGAARERALSEQRAARSEAIYRLTFDEAPVGIGHLDSAGAWARVNRRLCAILDTPATALLGRPLVRHAAEGESALAAAVERAATLGEPYHGEHRFSDANGLVHWIDLLLAPLVEAPGAPMTVVMDDVTDRRHAEEALRTSEAKFRRLSESGLVGIVFWDDAGQVTDANSALLELLGAGATARPTDLRWPEVAAPELARAADVELREAGVLSTREHELVRSDGTRVPVLVGGARLDTGGAVAFVVDMSERRRIEAERAHLVRELREAVRARDDFLAMAAHELKTPLTPLRLQTQRLARLFADSGPPTGVLANQIEVVQRSVTRMERLVDRLLDVSRVTVGHLVLDREEVDLAELAREVVERARDEADRIGSTITLTAPEPVPGRFDRLRLEQALGNLIGNALKYGAGRPIELTVSADEQRARLTVRDYGIGIAPEAKARIFERFERLVSVRHFGGFGLGLWIVRQIVEEHGGTVAVDSRPGEGACFEIVLPRQGARDQAPAETAAAAPS